MLCDKQNETAPWFLSSVAVDLQPFRNNYRSVSKPLDSFWPLSHRVISFAVCSSPWMSVIELSPLLSVSTPIRSLPPSLASLVLLRWARDVTTFASVPRSPWHGSSCWTGNGHYQGWFIHRSFNLLILLCPLLDRCAYHWITSRNNNKDKTGPHHRCLNICNINEQAITPLYYNLSNRIYLKIFSGALIFYVWMAR